MKTILTIAGSDSGGGAGIQADLKTITVLGGFGTSAITALTAQNTLGVQGVHPVPVDFIQRQIWSVACDFHIKSVKTGMLYDEKIIICVADALGNLLKQSLYVLDPVMLSKSGHYLLDKKAISALK